MDEPIEPAPTRFDALGQGIHLLLVVDVHLQDVWRRLHPPRALLRQAHGAAEAGQNNVGALPLCQVGDRKGEAGGGKDAGHQDLLPLEDARHGGPILSEPATRLRAPVGAS